MMNQDVTPSMTPTRHAPAEVADSQTTRSVLSAPPDTEFDALTDLFIGDAALSPHGDPIGEPVSAVLRIVPEDRQHSPVQATPANESAQRAPVPNLDPNLVPNVGPGSTPVQAAQPHITALVLGHLPVFASAWANQYARHLAESSGTPVAVLRVRGGYAAVDLVGANLPDIAAADSIEHAIRRAAKVTNRWVLRVGEPDEPALASCDAIDEMTLLTGIDEAAVVASYQTLKRFSHNGEVGPEITLAVMAATEEQAQPIARKISRATETFLERPARVICCIERITGGPSVHVFGGDSTITLDEALDLVRDSNEADREVTQQTQTAPIGESFSIPQPSAALSAVDKMLTDLIDGHDEANSNAPSPRLNVPAAFPIETSATTPPGTPGETFPSKPVTLHAAAINSSPTTTETASGTPPVQSPVQPLVQSPAAPTGLLDGLQTLQATCPYCESVSLAIDAHGSLHLIADANATIETQLVQLTIASGWAADHMQLLALTEPGLDAASYPTRHLITRMPAAVRRLLDSDLRVHLLVEVPGEHRVLVPLNYA